MTADQILTLARRELGTQESPAGSNCVKYNTAYYRRAVSGGNYAWCAVFLWWLFQEGHAAGLYFGGSKTAYCPTLLGHYQSKGREVTGEYRPGDIIFFNFNGKKTAGHVGLCEGFDGTYITTIDGNTGEGNEANGGAVMRRRRHKKYIVGAARPAYEGKREEDEEMTKEQIKALLMECLEELGEEPASEWAGPAIAQGKAQGLTDGTRPRSFATREEVVQMLVNSQK